MRSNQKLTAEQLEKYVLMYLKEGISYSRLAREYHLNIGRSVFSQYVRRYRYHGKAGLRSSKRNNSYTKEFKLVIVREYLLRKLSISEVAAKYNIPSVSTVRIWINQYTNGEELRSYAPEVEVYTMKSRKTTHEERVEIAKDCLKNGLSYKDTAAKYAVPYASVYRWVKKYKTHGPDGLVDGRGRGKPPSVQTEEEKLRAQLAAEKAKNEFLEAQVAALEKLEEIEREMMLKEEKD